MSIASGLPDVSTGSEAGAVTDAQHIASVIQILREADGERRLVVHPDTAEAFYTHHGGSGDEMRPHRLLWMVMFPREPGDTILIRVTDIHHPDSLRAGDPVVASAFRARHPHWPRCTWLIEHDQNAVETEPIAFPTDRSGRIYFKYDVVLNRYEDGELAKYVGERIDPWDKGRRLCHLDPGGHLIPDP